MNKGFSTSSLVENKDFGRGSRKNHLFHFFTKKSPAFDQGFLSVFEEKIKGPKLRILDFQKNSFLLHFKKSRTCFYMHFFNFFTDIDPILSEFPSHRK